MSQKLLGINVNLTHTTAQHELGVRVSDIKGGEGASSQSWIDVIDGTTTTEYFFPDAEYIYVKAGSAISAGNACIVDTAASNEPYTVIPSSAVAQVVVGLAQVAIASGSYGFIQTKGRHRVAVTTGAIAVGDKLVTSGTAGALQPLAQADTNFSSNNINALIAMAAGIGILALDSHDSNTLTTEVLIAH